MVCSLSNLGVLSYFELIKFDYDEYGLCWYRMKIICELLECYCYRVFF